ncbi:unnamed protein product [Knipowitschia caucasica]
MPGCLHGSCDRPWQCECHEGWGGRFCNKDLRACLSAPCLHGGTCQIADSGDATCVCAHGYHGDRCQLRAGPCHQLRSPCLNGGQCDDQSGFLDTFTCRCLAGFSGRRCEQDVDDCALSPCANGANGANANVALCSPCANGALCVDGVSQFTCVCAAGFSGRFCSVNIDECASRPCANRGRCVDRANGFRCLCRHGYSGPTCLSPPTPPANRTLRVTVRERGPAPLSQGQLVSVVMLALTTVAMVTVTATLVLHTHCGHIYSRCWGHCQRTHKICGGGA